VNAVLIRMSSILGGVGAGVGAAAVGQVAPTGAGTGARHAHHHRAAEVEPTLSRRAQFTSQVLSLATSDPAQAKQMVSELATSMQARASKATGAEADRLGKVVDMLSKAADSGDYAGLAAWGKGGGGSPVAQAYAWTRSSR
jgi:hypothetical protein